MENCLKKKMLFWDFILAKKLLLRRLLLVLRERNRFSRQVSRKEPNEVIDKVGTKNQREQGIYHHGQQKIVKRQLEPICILL